MIAISDWISFFVGVTMTLVLTGIIALWIVSGRHRCQICARKTKKTCRLYALPQSDPMPSPFVKLYAAYIFRECKDGHVTATVKTVSLSVDQQLKKKRAEFDWGGWAIGQLCIRSGVPNPVTKIRVVSERYGRHSKQAYN